MILISRVVDLRHSRAGEMLALLQHNKPVNQSAALNERNYGAWQGLNKADVAKQYGEA